MSVLLLVMVFAAAFVVVTTVRRGAAGAGRRVEVPSCGSCGYCVIGLETMTCPECGKDLREVGILTPGTAKPMSRGGRVFVWTLVSAAPLLIFSQVAAQWMAP